MIVPPYKLRRIDWVGFRGRLVFGADMFIWDKGWRAKSFGNDLLGFGNIGVIAVA